MPVWTLGDIMSQATARIGRRADIALSTASFWTNQAYLDFVREVPQALSERTTYLSLNSNTSIVAQPVDLYEVVSISHDTIGTSDGTLRQVGSVWADAQGFYPHATPEAYFLFNDRVHIWPSPNSSADTTVWSGRSYLMRYRAIPTDMSAATDVPVSVDTMHRFGIELLAEKYLLEYIGAWNEAAEAGSRYMAYTSSLKDSSARKQAASGRFSISLADQTGRMSRTSV